MERDLWAWICSSVFLGARGFLCFPDEIGLELGSLLPQIMQHFNKDLFLPHQSLFYACVWWWASKSHSLTV